VLYKILRGLYTLTGLILGYFVADRLLNTTYFSELSYFDGSPVKAIFFIALCVVVFGIILFLLSPWINSLIRKVMDYIEKSIQRMSAYEILFGAGGAIIGLIISSLMVNVITKIPYIGIVVSIAINIIMAVLGADVAVKKREDIISLFVSMKKAGGSKDKRIKGSSKVEPKVLDTSVIIDGRIFDICQTGFVEGPLIIPNFVLEELRHIADSSDSLKRNRGRRGLDILNRIQKELSIDVQIWEKDFPEIAEVDSKLLKLAQTITGKVITNDYNLNKVAEFQGVAVLNINELANAIKPVVLPGEEMKIQIIKDGKESGQGVAYLDDGTMIVVEGGKKFIGEIIDVIVTSVLQTAAGRMIFAKQKEYLEKVN
jgi:uncharacterized protein YacL